MKLNLGCGFNHLDGFINVDQHPSTGADFVWNLEELPWPWEGNSIEEIRLTHVLEHLGQQTNKYLAIIQEIYRVCSPDATVFIEVPHPLHPDFLGDPTHCRPVTYESLRLFDLDFANALIASRSPGTPLARYINVDFSIIDHQQFIDSARGILQVSRMTLKVRKPFRESNKELFICELSPGLGDICMALCVAHALNSQGYIVNFVTVPEWGRLVGACPYVNSVLFKQTEQDIFLSPAWYQLQASHQVDTLLKACKVTNIPNEFKSLDLNISTSVVQEMQTRFPGNKRVAINPACNTESRRWPLEYWQELVTWLLASDIEVCSLGMTSWYDQNNAYQFEGVTNVFDLDIFEAVAFLQQCKVLVSGDSGPIQLAGATDCGIVGLYSVIASQWRLPFRYGEQGWNAIGINTSCPHSPCYPKLVYDQDFNWTDEANIAVNTGVSLGDLVKNWCPNGDVTCMREIPVFVVYDAVMKLWNN